MLARLADFSSVVLSVGACAFCLCRCPFAIRRAKLEHSVARLLDFIVLDGRLQGSHEPLESAHVRLAQPVAGGQFSEFVGDLQVSSLFVHALILSRSQRNCKIPLDFGRFVCINISARSCFASDEIYIALMGTYFDKEFMAGRFCPSDLSMALRSCGFRVLPNDGNIECVRSDDVFYVPDNSRSDLFGCFVGEAFDVLRGMTKEIVFGADPEFDLISVHGSPIRAGTVLRGAPASSTLIEGAGEIGLDGDEIGEIRVLPTGDARTLIARTVKLYDCAARIAGKRGAYLALGAFEACGFHIHVGAPIAMPLDERFWRCLPCEMDVRKLNPPSRGVYARGGLSRFKDYGVEWRDLPASVMATEQSRAALCQLISDIALLLQGKIPFEHFRRYRKKFADSGIYYHPESPVVVVDKRADCDREFVRDIEEILLPGYWHVHPVRDGDEMRIYPPILGLEPYIIDGISVPVPVEGILALPRRFRVDAEFRRQRLDDFRIAVECMFT